MCVGSLPLVAVVPATVTSYKLFFHFRYAPTDTGALAIQLVNAGADVFADLIVLLVLNSNSFGVNLTVLSPSL